MQPFRIEWLDRHDRSAFVSGSEPLDRYLREQAKQDMRRRVASCFVAVDSVGAIAGFYTLAASSIVLDLLPADQAKRLPRYPVVPAVLLGRLAVARDCRGQRLGAALVADALMRSAKTDVMAYAMAVDANDEQAARFYEHLGFVRLPEQRSMLIRRC
jgi:ribosomal protein S18 acetylase RimI-like enzyme